jgi:hypothetical protein
VKFSYTRCHKKGNKNCERLLKEYDELMLTGQLLRAEVLRKRMISRYGKGIFADQGASL